MDVGPVASSGAEQLPFAKVATPLEVSVTKLWLFSCLGLACALQLLSVHCKY